MKDQVIEEMQKIERALEKIEEFGVVVSTAEGERLDPVDVLRCWGLKQRQGGLPPARG